MRFTHFYDLLIRFSSFIGGIMIVAAGADILDPVSSRIEQEILNHGWTWLWIIIMWAYIIVGFIGAVRLLNRTILPNWLSTFLYVRFTLFTKINPVEAGQLSYLFDGSMGGVWYPLGSIRKIDPNYRREALFDIANAIATKRGWAPPFAYPKDHIKKKTRNNNYQSDANEKYGGQQHQIDGDLQDWESLKILGLYEMPLKFDSIKQAYRRKISEYHPDKFAGDSIEVVNYAEKQSKKINAAYSYLERRFTEAIT